tara:strand:+ start:237 stop:506 length:270 start_codon:yes stop_codon:yes gene_type:complete
MSKVENFLRSYLEEYISSAQGPEPIIQTSIATPADMGRVFSARSKFKAEKTPNRLQEFLTIQNNPEALSQNVVAQYSPGFINAMSMFGR